MQNRTFIRTMLDILFDNVVAKSIASFVNFCNEQRYYNHHELKFLKKMPITNIGKKNKYQNKFIFTSSAQHNIGTK
jgi:hypothetical protein